MTRPVPVAIAAPGLPLPDPVDRATFAARKLEHLSWERNVLTAGALALAQVAKDNADDAYVNSGVAASAVMAAATQVTLAADQVTLATTQAGNAATSAAQAAANAGAALWVSGTTYAIGDARSSPATFQIYRRKTAGAGTTDPSADSTNWTLSSVNPIPIIVAGTTQTALAGNHYVMTNAAASTLTLPASPAANDEVWVTFTNGLYTNSIARNTKTIYGDALDFAVNAGVRLTWKFKYLNTDWKTV